MPADGWLASMPLDIRHDDPPPSKLIASTHPKLLNKAAVSLRNNPELKILLPSATNKINFLSLVEQIAVLGYCISIIGFPNNSDEPL